MTQLVSFSTCSAVTPMTGGGFLDGSLMSAKLRNAKACSVQTERDR